MGLMPSLDQTKLSKHYLETLLRGDRQGGRALLDRAIEHGLTARALLNELVWPTMELMQQLYREDRISGGSLNLATRLNRTLADQLAGLLPHQPRNGKKVLLFCGDAEPEELGGQICADLFEAEGYEVRFGGGGIPEDEVLSLIGEAQPDLLVLFATLPSGMPGARKLIDYLREVNSCPQMQILCCGGIYKRAEGLAEEIGADLFAPDAASAVAEATRHPQRRATPDQQTVGKSRRVRKAKAAAADVEAAQTHAMEVAREGLVMA
jgi:methanogenic corrinoid protein MtbC1